MTARLEVSADYFKTLVGPARAMDLLVRAGLTTPDAAPPAAIDVLDFWRCCAQNIQLTNDESHGIADGPVPRGSLSVLFTAAKEANDIGGALRRLVDAARLVRRDCTLTLSRGQGILRLTVRSRVAEHGPGRDPPPENATMRGEIYAECFAVVTHCALNWMAGRQITPVRARGAALPPSMGAGLLNALHTAVSRKGDGISIDYDLADMALPVVAQKYTVWGEAEFASFVAMVDHKSQQSRANEFTQALASFEHGHFSQDHLASVLRVSPATLRRKLTANGLSFRDLSTTYRIARLKDLLATDMPLIAIAEQLGLSDERSLRRFCVTHLGTAPASYRGIRS